MPFFEGMYSGYIYLTPCDIEFYISNERIDFKIQDEYKNFITKRSPMSEYEVPYGCHEEHFAWLPQWGVEVPEGYNVLYMTPFNGQGLPFVNTMGIINNDKTHHPGNLPFFIKKEFSGIIEKGTPYLQVIPLKRENWVSGKKILDPETIEFFKPGSGRIQNLYKDKIWERTKYE